MIKKRNFKDNDDEYPESSKNLGKLFQIHIITIMIKKIII
jgi:hypothetical protein